MALSEERRRQILEKVGAWPPPPKPEPVVKLATSRELSVEAQRERTERELRALGRAERDAAEQGRYIIGTTLYYERQEQALAEAKDWAVRVKPQTVYDPIARFEQEMRDE
jgi:hypothetical protein